MSDEELAMNLATFSGKGYIKAPAGYGKTHLIANSISLCQERQLILTHTYAGVNALRKKFQSFRVPSKKYSIDTIASWSLGFCLAYPLTSRWHKPYPIDNNDWKELYKSCSILLEKDFAKKIIQATYAGIYVDEYQDCNVLQHEIISHLSTILPCRILGDPLQGIFDFNDPIVNWEQQIFPHFENLGELTTPWRWRLSKEDSLGEWLKEVRLQLEKEGHVDLNSISSPSINIDLIDNSVSWNQSLYKSLSTVAKKHPTESIIVIFPGLQKQKIHNAAKSTSGIFSSIEEIEGKKLISFVLSITKAKNNKQVLGITVDFAKSCMTSVNQVLSTKTQSFELAEIQKNTKSPDITQAANNILQDPTIANIRHFLFLLKQHPDTRVFRLDLFNRAMGALRKNILSEGEALEDTLVIYQYKFRSQGRPLIYPRQIGTTLLVKGLEYDHAIVINPHEMSAKELYVAFTRGSKSLTIVTNQRYLPK